MIGILYALVPMVAWGLIGFIANKIGGDPKEQTLGMTLGALIFSFLVFLVIHPHLSSQVFLIGLAGGFIWAIGQFGQFKSMKFLGVAVASPLSGGSQLVLGTLLGAFVFHEWTKSIQFGLGLSALLLLIIGFYFSAKRDPSNPHQQVDQNLPQGLLALSYSTLAYVLYVIFFNNLASLWFGIKIDSLTIIFPMAIGMVIGAVIIAGGRVSLSSYVVKNMIVGVQWGIGNVFMLLAAKSAGVAIALTFSQIGALLSTVGGILFLGEKKTKKEILYIIIGGSLFAIGAILLAIVKSQGEN